jgi:hypothetical protein
VSAMRRAVGRHRLPFRVLLSADLASAAATGDGVILVRSGLWLRRVDVERVVTHEVDGHALPRHRASGEAVGLLRAGTAGAGDDEEGRALLLERRGGYLDAGRRAELGWRHVAGGAVRQGADFVDTVDRLLELAAPLPLAVRVAARVHRGGGLARELVYVPAFGRVSAALDADPELDDWLRRGRVSVTAAVVLRELGDPPAYIVLEDAA